MFFDGTVLALGREGGHLWAGLRLKPPPPPEELEWTRGWGGLRGGGLTLLLVNSFRP